MALQVKRFLTSVNAANCYLCWCSKTLEAVIIDPAEFSDEIRQEIADRNLQITGIIVTHGHYDHDSAVTDVRQAHQVPIYAVKQYPGSHTIEEDDSIEIGRESLYVAATPGHTEDSMTFIGDGLAFVGDALFAAAVGGTADRSAFEQETDGVARHILSLPACTMLYPGHGPATTVGVERCYNPFFID